ncbi:MAG TPA: GspE/PulE family protein [Phycisphaerae bacterium]|nr:GspE/PulE family protein [Phycisphaerae bacterium]HOJ73995.1 GspE/PulE family protein [Phycisphaerae bacterium]HOM50590.1 GspE/PulE family protein [Phycisphaerae bacterium]HON65099.1 GspE/PulE family protein [Phycisphaerae bacterium]HOQ86229.1 GspE/PulE family protein [Phycisphaerae bacterium]
MKKLIDIDQLATAEVPAPEIWNQLVEAAVASHASDIHMACQIDGVHVALRVDGVLREQGVLFPMEAGWRLINHVKVMGEMDLGERRRPQSGRARVPVLDRTVDLRISALPTNHGQDLVVRVLDATISLLELEQLGMRRRELNRVMGLLASPSGLVLVTGTTGAGKTTTLYAMLNRLNDGSRKIITLENPIEYDLPGINQAQVNYRLGVDYTTLLRTVLQQDPDVIMIGEVRDAETARAAVQAAVTGQLVFATLHAVGAVGAVESLLNLGVHRHFVARSLRGVVAQNLVRRVCTACAQRISETESVLPLDEVKSLLGPEDRPALAIGRGCDACYHSGYRGRMGLFEIMVADETLRRLIETGAGTPALRQAAIAGGMIPIQQMGKLAAFLGQTTVEELLRTVPWEETADAEEQHPAARGAAPAT